MKVYIQGSNQSVDLTQRNFLAQGGEGSVYVKGDTAFKVYHDLSKMIPVGKIHELSKLTDRKIVRPEGVLVDTKGRPVGYTSRFVKDAIPFCQIFPRSFREREGITHEVVRELIRKFQEGVEFVHQNGILLVDLNEMNFLSSSKFDDVAFIDVDSYETPHYPALALMESVRDWSVTDGKWSVLSDWFSFGIVAFQLFTGIHPYKGGYVGPKDEFKRKIPSDVPDDAFAVTRRRMRALLSVFHSDVKCPSATYPFSVIPSPYRAWFEAVFANGKRCSPPSDFGSPITVVFAVRNISGGKALDLTEVGVYPGTLGRMWSDGKSLVVSLPQGVWLDRVQVTTETASACGFSSRGGRAVVVFACEPGGVPVLENVTDRIRVPFDLEIKEVSSYDGRIYARTHDQVCEVVLTDAGSNVIASSRPVVNVLPHATRLFSGVVVQNILGSIFVSLLVRAGEARQIRVLELDTYRVLEAKYDGGVLMVMGRTSRGEYDRLIFRFDVDDGYDVQKVVNVAQTGLNFVTLDTGVCVCLNEEEKLEVFSSRRGSSGMKVVEDPVLGNDMILGKRGGTLLATQGSKIYSVRMK